MLNFRNVKAKFYDFITILKFRLFSAFNKLTVFITSSKYFLYSTGIFLKIVNFLRNFKNYVLLYGKTDLYFLFFMVIVYSVYHYWSKWVQNYWQLRKSLKLFNAELQLSFDIAHSDLSVGWGFIFYLTIIFSLTIATFYFGVNGVFQLSLFGVFVCWFNQFQFLDDIILQNKVFYYNSDFSVQVFGSVCFSLAFCVDYISFSFLFLTTSIGLCATAYSLAYFKNEPHADRFILYLNWFIISMSIFVTADNAFVCFLGWELIGLTSFLLINFWTLRRGTLKSAFKAFTFNKISDLFFLFFIIMMVQFTGSASILVWNQYLIIFSPFVCSELWKPALFLVLAASIKSAQFLGHLWLPDSMEAPIPASALIHSATLVSAGVYLLLRMQLLLQISGLNYIVGVLGAFTALYGGIVSAAQTDAKKLLAYSTISHCGFLFTTIFIGDVNLTLTYLYLHGFFKALTFFCVGNLLKVSRGYQDTRRMGHFSQFLPIESVLLVFSAANLGGLPFTIGFFYKHLFQSLFMFSGFFLCLAPFLMLAMLTSVIYVYRLVFYSLYDVKKGPEISYLQFTKKNLDHEKYSNTTPVSIIFIFSLTVFAYYYYLIYIQYNSSLSTSFPHTVSVNEIHTNPTAYVTSIIYYLLFCSLFGVVLCIITYIECRVEFSSLKKKYYAIYTLLFFTAVSPVFLIFFLTGLIYECEDKFAQNQPIKRISM